jgi:hypothetical protein
VHDLLLVRGSLDDISTRLPAADSGVERRVPHRRGCRTVPVQRPGAEPTILRGPSLAMGRWVRLGCRQRRQRWSLRTARPEGFGLHRRMNDHAAATRNSTSPGRECAERRALGRLHRLILTIQALLTDRAYQRVYAGFLSLTATLAAVFLPHCARPTALHSGNLAGVQRRRGQRAGPERGTGRVDRTQRQRRPSR